MIKNMNTTMQIPVSVTPVEALWALFKGQTKKVQREFSERLVQSNNAAILTPELAKLMVQVETAHAKGETISFASTEELDSYLENHEL